MVFYTFPLFAWLWKWWDSFMRCETPLGRIHWMIAIRHTMVRNYTATVTEEHPGTIRFRNSELPQFATLVKITIKFKTIFNTWTSGKGNIVSVVIPLTGQLQDWTLWRTNEDNEIPIDSILCIKAYISLTIFSLNFLPKGPFLDPSYSKHNKICICKRIGLALLYVHYKS